VSPDRMKSIHYGWHQGKDAMSAPQDGTFIIQLQNHSRRMARYQADPDAWKGKFVQMRDGSYVVRLRKYINGASAPGTWRVEFMDGPRRGEFAMLNVLSDTVDLSPLEELAWAEKIYADAG